VNGYYDPLLALFDRAVAEGFLKPKNRALVLTNATAAGILDQLAAWVPVPTEKWLDREQT
jgi:predicted Rossmann-fold nucleotide-binding protein